MNLLAIVGRRYNELFFTNMYFTTICKGIYERLLCITYVTGALNNHMRKISLDDSSLRISLRIIS